jgi:hypothetical protein
MNGNSISALALSAAIIFGGIIVRAAEAGDDLRVSLVAEPSVILSGKAVTLTLDVRDRNNAKVSDLPIVHENAIHLIVVPADLSELSHLHPVKVAKGVYRIAHTFSAGGRYRVYADLKSPQGRPIVVPFTLDVQGGTSPAAPLSAALPRGDRAEVAGVRAERTSPQRIASGASLELGFALTDMRTGGPVDDLAPYLGTIAHVIIISADGAEFVHAHAMNGNGGPGGAHSGHAMRMSHDAASTVEATRLTVHTSFPHSGLYRIWMQVQRRKQVITLPFVVRVEQ